MKGIEEKVLHPNKINLSCVRPEIYKNTGKNKVDFRKSPIVSKSSINIHQESQEILRMKILEKLIKCTIE